MSLPHVFNSFYDGDPYSMMVLRGNFISCQRNPPRSELESEIVKTVSVIHVDQLLLIDQVSICFIKIYRLL
jgi:hypothetical protein